LEPERTYLGDGLYAQLAYGDMIKLTAPRNYGEEHWVALEPAVFFEFCRFAASIGWGNIMREALRERDARHKEIPPAEPAAKSE
jgi:hypothetical protein